MTPLTRCLRAVAVALVLGASLVVPAEVVAAPVCVSRDEVGMAGAAGLQFPGGRAVPGYAVITVASAALARPPRNAPAAPAVLARWPMVWTAPISITVTAG